jgi:hypothetical protein
LQFVSIPVYIFTVSCLCKLFAVFFKETRAITKIKNVSIDRVPDICIRLLILLKVATFEVQTRESCTYSVVDFIFLYPVMKFLLIVDVTLGCSVLMLSLKLLNV